MPKLVSPFPFLSFFFFWGGGCRKNSGCLRGRGGGQRKMKTTQGGVYKIRIWTITNSSGPPQVILKKVLTGPLMAKALERDYGGLMNARQN